MLRTTWLPDDASPRLFSPMRVSSAHSPLQKQEAFRHPACPRVCVGIGLQHPSKVVPSSGSTPAWGCLCQQQPCRPVCQADAAATTGAATWGCRCSQDACGGCGDVVHAMYAGSWLFPQLYIKTPCHHNHPLQAAQLMVNGKDSSQRISFVDTAIYSRNRQFRMLGSSKFGFETCLQPTARFAMAGGPIEPRMLFFASLVTLVAPGMRLLTVQCGGWHS